MTGKKGNYKTTFDKGYQVDIASKAQDFIDGGTSQHLLVLFFMLDDAINYVAATGTITAMAADFTEYKCTARTHCQKNKYSRNYFLFKPILQFP